MWSASQYLQRNCFSCLVVLACYTRLFQRSESTQMDLQIFNTSFHDQRYTHVAIRIQIPHRYKQKYSLQNRKDICK